MHEASTLLGGTEAPPPVPALHPGPTLDLCHVGVVLRAVLGVLAALMLGSALESRTAAHWLARFTDASVVAVPAVLAWIVVVCGLRGVLQRCRAPLQLAAVTILGAGSALMAWRAWALWLTLDEPSPWSGAAVALGGALGAAWLVQSLRLRALAQGPVGMQARLVELQARIRPHFLFNTLNTAVALVRLDPSQAERVLEDLAELFRAALSAPSDASTLAAEVELAERYLGIETLRFGERLRVDWQLDPACGQARVPVLLLQPLVENAVRYGVEPNDEGGEVLVRTRRKGNAVELLVRNTVRASAPGGHGLALANVQERLRLMHDVAARCSIERDDAHFTVRILLPL
ncbi:sensor histidine kinase [Inhella crocodyli]|uniref:sensor histidine kinase n=1 Tax=Inhella crocodyli TaxID=2499851 RepID=UPI001F0B9136|nr:histidine kinase [Inhella crocodyli]